MNKVEITIDVVTGQTVTSEIPFTQQEIDYSAKVNEEQAQAIVVRESALAKLAALGLTQDEVKALVG
jgi:hypothetical protein